MIQRLSISGWALRRGVYWVHSLVPSSSAHCILSALYLHSGAGCRRLEGSRVGCFCLSGPSLSCQSVCSGVLNLGTRGLTFTWSVCCASLACPAPRAQRAARRSLSSRLAGEASQLALTSTAASSQGAEPCQWNMPRTPG